MTGVLFVASLVAPSVPHVAHAQPVEGSEDTVGDAADAMPGYVRTHVANERPVGFAANATFGYGLTESLRDAPGPHHRTTMSLAVSAQPLTWLSLALRFDGRADFHPADMMGNDRGAVASGSFALRGAKLLGHGLGLGAQLTMLTSGGTASFGFDGLSLEATGLVSYRSGGLSLAAELGYRVDRSARTIHAGAMYRLGDQLALGVSDFDAVLVRIGAGYRHDAIEIMGELTWDALVGDGAPSFTDQPLHAAIGGRHHTSHSLQIEAVIDVCLSSRPAIGNGTAIPFVVVDPRVAFRFGATYRFGREARGTIEDGVERTPPGEDPEEAEPLDVVQSEPDAVAGDRVLRGVVHDEAGAPIVDAHVVVRVGDRIASGYTGAEGQFVIEGIPEGDAEIEVTATRYAAVSVALGSGALALPGGTITMQHASALGVIRGLVRDFEGHPVRATVRLRPGSASTQTSDDGTFQIEVPPGRYTVVVEAPSFVSQTRPVELVDGQVTIYNVDLRRE